MYAYMAHTAIRCFFFFFVLLLAARSAPLQLWAPPPTSHTLPKSITLNKEFEMSVVLECKDEPPQASVRENTQTHTHTHTHTHTRRAHTHSYKYTHTSAITCMESHFRLRLIYHCGTCEQMPSTVPFPAVERIVVNASDGSTHPNKT